MFVHPNIRSKNKEDRVFAQGRVGARQSSWLYERGVFHKHDRKQEMSLACEQSVMLFPRSWRVVDADTQN